MLDFVGLLLTAVVYEDLVHLRLVRGVYLRLVSCIGNNNTEARRTSTIELTGLQAPPANNLVPKPQAHALHVRLRASR